MKFSFESQNYRDHLSHELMNEEDKSKRKALLEEEMKKIKYFLAEHVTNFRKKKKDSKEAKKENVEQKKKKRVIRGIDESGEPYAVELEIDDISDEVPESVKIIYDMNRLLEIEANFKSNSGTRGWYTETGAGSYINRDMEDPFFYIVRKYLKRLLKKMMVYL